MKDAEKTGGRLWGGAERAERPADRRRAEPEPSRLDAPDDRTYTAFEIRENAERLHLKCATGPSRFPGYNYLLDIVYDHDFGSIFTLIYSFMVVEVTGKNLGPIVHAISFRNCDRVREFHRKLYDPPIAGEPIVEMIKITAAAPLPVREE